MLLKALANAGGIELSCMQGDILDTMDQPPFVVEDRKSVV